MPKLFLKFLLGVLAIPVAFGVSVSFYKNVILIAVLAGSLKYFLWGIASYAVIHLLFYKPTYLYVLGHEAVHAGVVWIFGGKVKSFKVSKGGGSVGATKSNVVIDLSPYFVPIYAIIITIVYFIVASSYNINGSVFMFLVGFALAFHMISTIEVMKIRQPDIIKSGYLFSIVMVYALNVIVISVIFGLLFPSFSVKSFFIDAWRSSWYIYTGSMKQLFF
jgi:hypothetical protein